MNLAFAWPDEAITALRTMRAKGESCSNIAKRLSRDFHHPLTRNAVIGKCSRLGISMSAARKAHSQALSNRVQATASRNITEREAARLAKLKRLQEAPVVEKVVALPKSRHPDDYALAPKGIMTLGYACCRWPLQRVADDGSTLFCGNDAGDARPYCPAHKALSTQKARSPAAIAADAERLKSTKASLARKGMAYGWGGVRKVSA